MVKFWVGFALLIAAIAVFSHWHGPLIGDPLDLHFSSARDSDERGSGVARSETRQLEAFGSIHAEGASLLEVEVKDGLAHSVEIGADDNLLQWVRTEVRAGVLEISPAVSMSPVADLKIKVTAPALSSIHLEGANRLKLDIDTTGDLDVHLEGAGRMNASGRVGRLVVRSEGAGSIEALELVARAVDVRIEGAGRADVHATESLKARIEGAGIIRYAGNPKDVDKDVEGFGRISRAE